MRSLVLYYTNTGNTQKVARSIADGLGAELAELTCETYLRWYGPLAMAWDIFTRHIPKIDVLVPPDAKYDLVVIGGPVWAARLAPPVVALLKQHLWDDARKGLFVTCNGTAKNSPPDAAIAEMALLTTGRIVGTRIFREAEIHSDAYRAAADTFAREVEGKAERQSGSSAA